MPAAAAWPVPSATKSTTRFRRLVGEQRLFPRALRHDGTPTRWSWPRALPHADFCRSNRSRGFARRCIRRRFCNRCLPRKELLAVPIRHSEIVQQALAEFVAERALADAGSHRSRRRKRACSATNYLAACECRREVGNAPSGRCRWRDPPGGRSPGATQPPGCPRAGFRVRSPVRMPWGPAFPCARVASGRRSRSKP